MGKFTQYVCDNHIDFSIYGAYFLCHCFVLVYITFYRGIVPQIALNCRISFILACILLNWVKLPYRFVLHVLLHLLYIVWSYCLVFFFRLYYSSIDCLKLPYIMWYRPWHFRIFLSITYTACIALNCLALPGVALLSPLYCAKYIAYPLLVIYSCSPRRRRCRGFQCLPGVTSLYVHVLVLHYIIYEHTSLYCYIVYPRTDCLLAVLGGRCRDFQCLSFVTLLYFFVFSNVYLLIVFVLS